MYIVIFAALGLTGCLVWRWALHSATTELNRRQQQGASTTPSPADPAHLLTEHPLPYQERRGDPEENVDIVELPTAQPRDVV